MSKITLIIDNECSQRVVRRKLQYLGWGQKLQVTIEPYKKKRSTPQNAMQWVSVLGDFSMQGIINGRQFSAAIWHEYLKESFLPNEFTPGETLKNYIKWVEMPDGKLKMIGSTTRLTTLGFSHYVERCYAYGAGELGIKFTMNPNDPAAMAWTA
jgi:hypothetical protein